MALFVTFFLIFLWVCSSKSLTYTRITIDTFLSSNSHLNLIFTRLNCRIAHFMYCATSCEDNDCCVFFHHNAGEKLCHLLVLNHDELQQQDVGIDAAFDAFKMSNRHNTGYIRSDFNQSGWCLPPAPIIDCSVHKTAGHVQSREYTIKPDNSEPVQVYCDMDTDGGGWTHYGGSTYPRHHLFKNKNFLKHVFQRRKDGSENFYRTWAEYENGFGNLSGEFWLGNAVIASITSQGSYELRIDMEDAASQQYYALYSTFSIDGADGYRLSLGSYTGDAGDSLKSYHNGQKWTTYDQDNDPSNTNCAVIYRGAWWYSSCHHSNLNGEYGSTAAAQGINWYAITRHTQSLRFTEMKLRPAGQN